jgi:hypothetical protein
LSRANDEHVTQPQGEHAGWLVTLHSPEEQDFSGKTLEEALAWCLVWLMMKGTQGDWGHELGIGPILV